MSIGKSLLLALLVFLGFFLLADMITKYTIYFGPFPIYRPFAFLGPIIQGVGIGLAVIVFILLFLKRR